MTDAPEKIWVQPRTCTVDASGASRLLAMDREFAGGTQYTRTDVALAMVAAEREACSVTTEEDRDSIVEAGYVRYRANQRGGARGQTVTEWDGIESHIIQAYSDHIRARTDADAQAALERVKREARNEALREAHQKISEMWASTTKEHMDAILALMEGEDDEPR